MFNLGDIFVTFKAKTQELDQGLQKVDRLTKDVQKSVNRASFKDFANNASNAFGSVADKIQSVAVKTALLATASSFGAAKFVSLAGDLQTAQQRMTALAGSADDAKQIMGELYSYVLGKPIAFPDAAKAAQTLMGYGVAAKDVVKHMKTLSAFSIVNGSDLDQLALAMGQVNAKGRLMGQEVIQLTNNFVPVSQVIAKHFNVSIKKAQELIEGGNVSAKDFNKAMADFIPQDKIDAQANTFKNRMISLQGSIRSFGLALIGVKVDPKLGLVVEPGGIFDRLSNFIPKLAKGLSDLKPKVVGAFKWLMDNGDVVRGVLIGIAAAFTTAKLAAIGFAITAAMNPFVAIATGVTILVGLLAGFIATNDKVRNRLMDLYRTVRDYLSPKLEALMNTVTGRLVPAMKDLWKAIEPIVKIFAPVAGAGLVWAIGLTIDAINLLIAAFSDIVGWISRNEVVFWGLVGVFGALAAAMTFNKIFNALTVGFNVLRLVTIPNAMASVSALKGLIMSPTTLGAIGVGAAIAALVLVKQKLDEIKKTADKTFESIRKNTDGAITGIEDAKKKLKEGKITADQYKKSLEAYNNQLNQEVQSAARTSNRSFFDWVRGRASGGVVMPGQAYMVGEAGRELFIPESKGSIMPAQQTERFTQSAGDTINIHLNGAFARNNSDLQEIADQIVTAFNQKRRAQNRPQIGAA